jgi:hypothetical protein
VSQCLVLMPQDMRGRQNWLLYNAVLRCPLVSTMLMPWEMSGLGLKMVSSSRDAYQIERIGFYSILLQITIFFFKQQTTIFIIY